MTTVLNSALILHKLSEEVKMFSDTCARVENASDGAFLDASYMLAAINGKIEVLLDLGDEGLIAQVREIASVKSAVWQAIFDRLKK